MTDPKVYAKPIALTIPVKLLADTEMLEGFCENHHQDRERMALTKAATASRAPSGDRTAGNVFVSGRRRISGGV
jgi:hypothetical protein